MVALLLLVSLLATPPVTDVVAKARHALGIERLEALPHGLRLDGTLETPAASTDVSLVFDRETRFAHHVLGAGASSFGFDGEVAWLEAADGGAGELATDDAVRLLATTWFLTGQWLLDDCPVLLAGERETEETWTLAFEILVGKKMSGEVDVSRGTGFPRAFRWDDGDVVVEHLILGFRTFEGMRVPHRVMKREADVKASQWTFLAGAPADAGAFERAATSRGATARFDPDAPAELTVKRLRSGHLLVKPRLDGQEVGWFLLDSGSAGMLLSKNDANRLELERFGATRVHGVAGSFEGRFARAASLRLGPLVLERPLFTVVDMSTVVRGFGHPLSGLVGFDVLAPCVAELDVERGRVRLFEPARAPFDEDLEWTPLALHGRHAVVTGEVEGNAARLVLDTGSDSALTLQPAFTEATGLLEGRPTRPARLSGASRQISVRTGRVARFDFAGRRFGDVPATFLQVEGGGAAASYADGIVGLPVLEGLRLVLDYPRRRLALLRR